MLGILHFWEILRCVQSSPASFKWPIKTENVSVCIYNHVDWPGEVANCKTSGQSYKMHVLQGSIPDTGPFIPSHPWSGWSHFLLWETTRWPKLLISTFCIFSHFSSCFWILKVPLLSHWFMCPFIKKSLLSTMSLHFFLPMSGGIVVRSWHSPWLHEAHGWWWKSSEINALTEEVK